MRVDYSKKYESLQHCGNHVGIFSRNIFCVIAGATGSGKTNLMVNLLLQEQKNELCIYLYLQSNDTPNIIRSPERHARINGGNYKNLK